LIKIIQAGSNGRRGITGGSFPGPSGRNNAKEVGTMSTKAKVGIVLGTAALALAAYSGYRYWKRRASSR